MSLYLLKKYLLVVFVALGLCSFAQKNYEPNSLLFQIKSNASIDNLQKTIALNVNSQSVFSFECISVDMQIWKIIFNEQTTSQDLLFRLLKEQQEVIHVQYDHFVEQRVLEPNDTRYIANELWAFKNTGQNGGLVDADIDAPEAWQIATGGLTATGDTIVIAIIDGGALTTHTDLNIWKNYSEIPANGIDDDANGYVDDFLGWNSLNTSGVPFADSHGTHVTGIAGAKGNNGIGVTGVNWNVKTMIVSGSSTVESAVIAAYAYVLKQRKIYNQTNGQRGAFVVATNSSFGVNNGSPSSFPLWCAMYDSLGVQGILSCGATANVTTDVEINGDIPTTCASNFLISVTNTTNQDQLNSMAAYGVNSIDLGAPGTDIVSTTLNNNFGTRTGTSMATPMVAGSVGLLFSAMEADFLTRYKSNPSACALQIKSMLLNGTDVISALQNITVTSGRLNLFNAVKAIKAPIPITLVPTFDSLHVAQSSDLSIEFDEDIVLGSGKIELYSGTTLIESYTTASPLVSVVANKLIIDPSVLLPAGLIHVIIEKGFVRSLLNASDFIGYRLEKDWQFTVDNVVPLATTYFPADEAVNVPANSILRIHFNEWIQMGSGNIYIDNGTSVTTLSVSDPQVLILDSTITINLTADMDFPATYTITSDAGFVLDLAGNSILSIANTDWNFSTTSPFISTLSIASLTPNDDQLGVNRNVSCSIKFNTAILKNTSGFIYLKMGTTILQSYSVHSSDVQCVANKVNFVATNLPSLSPIHVEIDPAVFIDIYGNTFTGIANTTDWNFTTGDFESPVVTSYTPTIASTLSVLNPLLQIEFNEPVVVGSGVIKLYANGNFNQSISVLSTNVSCVGSTLVCTLTKNLPSLSHIDVTLDYGIVRDGNNNPFIGISNLGVWNFETEPVGINEIEKHEFANCSVFPNPFWDEIIVRSSKPFSKIVLTGVLGNTIETYLLDNTTTARINTQQFKNGVYFVTIEGDSWKQTLQTIK